MPLLISLSHNYFEKDLVITQNNMRLLAYNIYFDKITPEKKAKSNYFNSFNNKIKKKCLVKFF